MAINTGKVIVGGLAAGVVMNVIDFASQTYLLGPRMSAEMDAFSPGMSAKMTASGPAGFVVMDFVIALILVWTYAAIRPRFGAGPGTAVKAGVALWVATGAVWAFMPIIGMISWTSWGIAGIIGIINLQASAYVGAMIYKED